MTLTLTIATDNAAFEGESLGPELRRILYRLAADICRDTPSPEAHDGMTWHLHDSNGNPVGKAELA